MASRAASVAVNGRIQNAESQISGGENRKSKLACEDGGWWQGERGEKKVGSRLHVVDGKSERK